MTQNFSNLPKWNLGDLYNSITDPKINEDIKNSDQKSNDFVKNFKNTKFTKGDDLATAITKYEQIEEILGKLSTFAYLNYAGNLANEANVAFYQNICEKIREISTKLLFFTLNLNEIPNQDLEKLTKESENLAKYQPFLRDVRQFKKYQLEENLEKLFLQKATTASAAWNRLFDETVNNLEFDFEGKKLNSAQIFDLFSHKDASKRKKAAESVGKVLKENSKIFAFITNILAKDKEISDQWRGFASPISSRNLSNFIEDEVVDCLTTTVKQNYQNISHRYYKIKAKILGKEKLHYSDRNAPLPEAGEEKISWQDAKNIVLDSYNKFDPKMAKIGQEFFDKNWIDAGVRDGKESGAFSHPCVPSSHPYILLNYQGKLRDVATLAHELGHGIHQVLSAKQGYLMADTPLTLAETASVFGEQLTFQALLAKETSPKKRKLIIAGKVEDMINTVIRQIAFLEFERKIHNARKTGEIPLSKICDFWMEVQQESLGDIFEYDENYRYFWSYIPHFIHSPFYVYSYAFGECLVNALYGVYQEQKIPNFEQKYLQMLKAGGTLHHKDLLAPFNLDATKSDFWQKGLDVISNFIDQLEQ